MAHEGQSVFCRPGGGTRIGERVGAGGVTLYSDPGYAGLECSPFTVATASDNESSVFDNGLPLDRTDWIRDGDLAALVQTRHTAALTGQPVTPGVDNLVLQVDGAGGAVEDMVAGTDRGLLLTCLWYIREVDPQTLLLTGLTRDGVYLVEDGEITAAVNNFRFNESPVDLLAALLLRDRHGPRLQPRVGRLLPADGDAGAADPRLQHVERLPGPLTMPRAGRSPDVRRPPTRLGRGPSHFRYRPNAAFSASIRP